MAVELIRHSPVRPRAELAFIISLLLVASVLLGGFFLKLNGADGLPVFSDISLTSISILGGLVTLILAFNIRGADRRSWLLIGGGILSWGVGQTVWTYHELVLGIDRPFPSVADAGYLLMIPLMFAGLVTLPVGARRSESRMTVGLDSFIVMASVATVSWFAVLGPIYADATANWETKLFGLLYPAGDLLLLFALIGGVARGWFARRNPVVASLLLGIGLFIAADLGFAFLTVNNEYTSGSLIDLGWPLGFLFATYAAARRWTHGEAEVHSADSSPRFDAVLRFAPYPVVLGVTALLFISGIPDRTVDRNVFVLLALATVILVLVRQFFMLRENQRLNLELRRFSHSLEGMVQERTIRLATLHNLGAALCSAASADEVSEIGLRTLRMTVKGSAAVLLLGENNEWLVAAGYPQIPAAAVSPTPDTLSRLRRQEVVCGQGDEVGRGTVWIPASDRGQVYGCIAVLDSELDQAHDIQHLATIGAEFGVAFQDQRRFEASLRNEARFRSLVQNSSDIVTVVDADGIIRYHSPAAKNVFGDEPDSLIGTEFSDLLHPDDVIRGSEFLDTVISRPGATAAVEWRRRVPSGWHPVETLATNLLGDPSVLGIILNSRDISERKVLEEQLRQSQKMEVIGQLAGGVAHDFNNLLTVIIGYGEILLSRFAPGSPEREPIETIIAAGASAAALTRQLLAFSRRQVISTQDLDLNVVIESTSRMLRRLIGEDIDLVTGFGADVGLVKADPGQIDQILMNLAANARDAMPGGGTLTLATTEVTFTESNLSRHSGARLGTYVALTVRDTGTGMDPATKARIFEPFFTTKEIGKGTGLGLAAVYGIVIQQGGFIEVDTATGRGTTFRIYLPQVERSVDSALAGSIRRQLPHGVETILLVDDEAGLRRIARHVLERSGYTVIEAETGDEALRLVSKHVGLIDLVLTDVVMPGMNGRVLVERLLSRQPDLKVLYMSGYTDDVILRNGVSDSASTLLQKPFTSLTLGQTVRTVLDAA